MLKRSPIVALNVEHDVHIGRFQHSTLHRRLVFVNAPCHLENTFFTSKITPSHSRWSVLNSYNAVDAAALIWEIDEFRTGIPLTEIGSGCMLGPDPPRYRLMSTQSSTVESTKSKGTETRIVLCARFRRRDSLQKEGIKLYIQFPKYNAPALHCSFWSPIESQWRFYFRAEENRWTYTHFTCTESNVCPNYNLILSSRRVETVASIDQSSCKTSGNRT